MNLAPITVSIVSHGQNALVNRLLADLTKHCTSELHVILTENIPEPLPLELPAGAHRFEHIINEHPKGFGANHNSAFARSGTELFFVVNPDIRLLSDPFPSLALTLQDAHVAAAGPLVRNSEGALEDSARRFPTAASLLAKLFQNDVAVEYPVDKGPLEVEWLAGMFLGFRREAYLAVGGFDERYFLYYEDVDICRRLRSRGYKVIYATTVSVIHEARRASRSNPRLMCIHAASAIRYLFSSYPEAS
jgi:N-acetylglucosaminyl-diphospho-decaprenol L-rhamnosyltransferase